MKVVDTAATRFGVGISASALETPGAVLKDTASFLAECTFGHCCTSIVFLVLACVCHGEGNGQPMGQTIHRLIGSIIAGEEISLARR